MHAISENPYGSSAVRRLVPVVHRVSIGAQKGPRIGVQKGPPRERLVPVVIVGNRAPRSARCEADAAARGGLLWTPRCKLRGWGLGGGRGAVLEPPLPLPVSTMSQWWVSWSRRAVVIWRRRTRWAIAKSQVCRHDHGRLLVDGLRGGTQLSAGLSERQVAELVEHDEVHAAKIFGHASVAAGAALGLKLVDQVDHVEEPAALAVADACASDRDGKVGLAGAGSADQHEVPLMSQEVAAGEVADKGTFIGVLSKVKSSISLASGSLAMVI